MEEEIACPYCGESISVWVDAGGGSTQRYVEDCSVCCRPIEIAIDAAEEEGAVSVTATRSDE